ncbi:MAG: hypothetical protein IKM26_08595 [Clostridia bacterium]|nr:hypothetical protein [Clostridia bacterium]
MPETTTVVHDEQTRSAVLLRTQKRENNRALCALLYAQMLILSALSLLSTASTSACLSLLLALLPGAALYALAALCAKKHQKPPRPLALCYALLFFSDMALCLMTLTELVCAYVLPHHARLLVMLAAAAGTGLMLSGRQMGGARRAAAFLTGFFLFALLICLIIALPECSVSHAFPLLGYGAGQTLRGALQMTGSLWLLGALPFFTQDQPSPPLRRRRPYLLPLMTILLMAFLLFFYACLLPAPLLPGKWGFVLQLQLIMEMSPSILSWSLMLISRMLLFLAGFATAGDMTGECLHMYLPGKKTPALLLTLLSVPLALLPPDKISPFLPLRFLCCTLVVIIALFLRKKDISA